MRTVKIACFVEEAWNNVEELGQYPCQNGITLGTLTMNRGEEEQRFCTQSPLATHKESRERELQPRIYGILFMPSTMVF